MQKGSVRQRGKSFRISYYDLNGIRQFETFKSLEEAERELASRIAEIAKGIPVSSAPNQILFEELCADVLDDYEINGHSTYDDQDARLRCHILPVFGRRKACQITTSMIRSYIKRRKLEGAKPGTINRELELMIRAFNLALKERKILTAPHIPKLTENNTRVGFFTREEVEKLCSFLKEPYASFVMFGFLTGWRYSEIQGLQWRNVDFQANEIRLDPGTTKNGEARVFPMSARLRTLLESAARASIRLTKPKPKESPSANMQPLRMPTVGAVFSIAGAPIGAFRKTWRAACIKAGFCIRNVDGEVVKITRMFHDLRRSAARQMEIQGLSQSVIMQLMGHKTDSMFQRYRIVSSTDLKNAAKLLDGADSGAKSGESCG